MHLAPRTSIVTRREPPFHRALDGFGPHPHHRHGHVFFFTPFFAPFGYLYSLFYGFGAAFGYEGSRSVIPEPYYCWIHGIGFSDEAQFAQHLHDAHGVPLDEALSASEQVDGRYVFYGY
jgi:hypothetical protein